MGKTVICNKKNHLKTDLQTNTMTMYRKQRQSSSFQPTRQKERFSPRPWSNNAIAAAAFLAAAVIGILSICEEHHSLRRRMPNVRFEVNCANIKKGDCESVPRSIVMPMSDAVYQNFFVNGSLGNFDCKTCGLREQIVEGTLVPEATPLKRATSGHSTASDRSNSTTRSSQRKLPHQQNAKSNAKALRATPLKR